MQGRPTMLEVIIILIKYEYVHITYIVKHVFIPIALYPAVQKVSRL